VPLPRQALVLTAGLGTRLRPLTLVRAKPAIPVAGTPMILRIVGWLAANGVTDQILNLHHLPATITAVVGDGSGAGAHVRYSWEPVILGSAGGPRHAMALVDGRSIFIVNGDTLTDVNLPALAAAHERTGARVTLALVPNVEPMRYGGVAIDDDGVVKGFVPRGRAARGSHHFVGVQIADLDVFAGLADGLPAASIGGVYDALMANEPGAVRGVVCDARFWDVGTAADYLRTHEAFAAAESAPASCGQDCRIDPTARVAASILWDHVHVGAGCQLDECIVADGVEIPAGSRFSRAAIVAEAGCATPIVAPIDDHEHSEER
jgi:NDP-sugar pyrophosphorylase family protein